MTNIIIIFFLKLNFNILYKFFKKFFLIKQPKKLFNHLLLNVAISMKIMTLISRFLKKIECVKFLND